MSAAEHATATRQRLSQTTRIGVLGLLAIATLPARAAIAGAELVIATGRLAARDGPVRRAG